MIFKEEIVSIRIIHLESRYVLNFSSLKFRIIGAHSTGIYNRNLHVSNKRLVVLVITTVWAVTKQHYQQLSVITSNKQIIHDHRSSWSLTIYSFPFDYKKIPPLNTDFAVPTVFLLFVSISTFRFKYIPMYFIHYIVLHNYQKVHNSQS